MNGKLLVSIFVAEVIFGSLSTSAQGRLAYYQSEGRYQAITLAVDPCDPATPLTRLTGVGYSAELWYRLGDTSDESQLEPFLQGGYFNQQGIIRFPSSLLEVPGGFGGDLITLQLRVWDNQNGSIATWGEAIGDTTAASGKSSLIRNRMILAGDDQNGIYHLGNPNFYGAHEAFSISAVCPEPSSYLLFGAAAGIAWLMGPGRRRSRLTIRGRFR